MTTQRTKLSLLASLFSSFFFTTAFGQSPGSWLGDLTWPEAESRIASAPAVVMPFGAGANEHGPQLPMNADAKVMEYLCERAIEALPVVVAPPILHGWFPAFRQFPGTEVADHDAFVRYVSAVARSLVRHGTRRLVFLNTGISRATGLPLSIVAREIQVERGSRHWWFPGTTWKGPRWLRCRRNPWAAMVTSWRPLSISFCNPSGSTWTELFGMFRQGARRGRVIGLARIPGIVETPTTQKPGSQAIQHWLRPKKGSRPSIC